MRFRILLLLLGFSCFLNAANIHFDLSFSSSLLYVASYYGSSYVVQDSLRVHDGKAVWNTSYVLPEGIYFVTDKKHANRFEFLVGKDQDFELLLPSLSLAGAQVKGADESEIFLAFTQLARRREVTNEEKIHFINNALEHVGKETMLYLTLNALSSSFVLPQSNMVMDSESAYECRCAHYWDGYDLNDARLVRTPFFVPRIRNYLKKVLWQREDKIKDAVLPLLRQVESCPEILRVFASESLFLAFENNIMGIDALGYEVMMRYYLSGELGVLPTKEQKMLEDYVKHTENCRVGQRAKEIRLVNWQLENGEVSLLHQEAKYTLLLFWEPDCSYCTQVIPVLRDHVYKDYNKLGLRIFAVNTQRDVELWKNYILDNHLEEWTHGIQLDGESGFMVDFGVEGTPYMYILDQEKKIVAKNVKLDFLDQMLSRLFTSGSIY